MFEWWEEGADELPQPAGSWPQGEAIRTQPGREKDSGEGGRTLETK